MWSHGDLVLPLVSIASLLCMVNAQSGADGPSNACPQECIGKQCARIWWTTMWGFIVTLVALTMDVWGHLKSWEGNILLTLLSSVLNPLAIVWHMIAGAVNGMAMLGNLREALGDDMVAPFYPWSKSHIKLIMGSDVVVNLSPNVHSALHNSNAFRRESNVEDLSEALVIGIEVPNSHQYNVELSPHGKLALLRANVLPAYDQLKFLRGSSSLGMVVVAVQAIGYMYGIVVRCVQDLRVSPIEVIAFVLNIVILMKVLLHNFASLGHRPLLLFLRLEQEAKFVQECTNTRSFRFKVERINKLVVSITCVSLVAVVAYFSINLLVNTSLNRACILPLYIWGMSLVLGGMAGFNYHDSREDEYLIWNEGTGLSIVLSNFGVYVLALVATFKYWEAGELDVQSSKLYLSQVLPYIG